MDYDKHEKQFLVLWGCGTKTWEPLRPNGFTCLTNTVAYDKFLEKQEMKKKVNFFKFNQFTKLKCL